MVLVLCVGATTVGSHSLKTKNRTPAEIRKIVNSLHAQSRLVDLLRYFDDVQKEFGTLKIDNEMPSLYNFLGVAQFTNLLFEEAEESFKQAVFHFPDEVQSYINMGEVQLQSFKLEEAIRSFELAAQHGEKHTAAARIIRAKGWAASWKDFELYAHTIEQTAKYCLENINCGVDVNGGLEYTDATGHTHKVMSTMSPNAKNKTYQVPPSMVAPLWLQLKTIPEKKGMFSFTSSDSQTSISHTYSNSVLAVASAASNAGNIDGVDIPPPRLKVGVVSSDFGVHPVSQLLRGMFQFLDTRRIELFAFALNPTLSWWGTNISQTVEHFVWLNNTNTRTAAETIANYGIEVLIDLNGHTQGSGLTIFGHRPAPVQMTFLGLPVTTGGSYMDYVIGDHVALPPECRDEFVEKVALLTGFCYIVNDYAQLLGGITEHNDIDYPRAPRSSMMASSGSTATATGDINRMPLLFGTLSNSQKMDPKIFEVWMNILRRFPEADMIFMDYAGSEFYMANLHASGSMYGITKNRLKIAFQNPWIDHLYAKTSLDLVLDTQVKTGHTTGQDSIWAGIPTITFAGGRKMSSRAGESIASALESDLGLVYSLKEYEDLAFAIAADKRKACKENSQLCRFHALRTDSTKKPIHTGTSLPAVSPMKPGPGSAISLETPPEYRLLNYWRRRVQEQRLLSPLFDTRGWTGAFSSLLLTTWEVTHISEQQQIMKELSEKKKSKSNPAKSGSASASSCAEGVCVEDVQKDTSIPPKYHIFAARIPRSEFDALSPIRTQQAFDDQSCIFHDKNNRAYICIDPKEGDEASEVLLYDSDGHLLVNSPGRGGVSHRMWTAMHTRQPKKEASLGITAREELARTSETKKRSSDSGASHTSNTGESNTADHGTQAQQTSSSSSAASSYPQQLSVKTGQLSKQRPRNVSVALMAAIARAGYGVQGGDMLYPFVEKIPRPVDDEEERELDSGISSLLERRLIPRNVLEQELLLLNIGGEQEVEGWTNIILPGNVKKHAQIVRELHDLHGFTNQSVSVVYCRHKLQLAAFYEFETIIQEWFRVLRNGGLLLLTMPDLRAISYLHLNITNCADCTVEDRIRVMEFIYGDQSNVRRYQQWVGFVEETVTYFLAKAGFCSIERVGNFNLDFEDDDEKYYFKGYSMSMNIAAKVCTHAKNNVESPVSSEGKSDSNFAVQHHADPYREKYVKLPASVDLMGGNLKWATTSGVAVMKRDENKTRRKLKRSQSLFGTKHYEMAARSPVNGNDGEEGFGPVPRKYLEREILMLNVGGFKTESPVWVNVNAQSTNYGHAAEAFDGIMRHMHDLHGLANSSVSAIYSSHTLEHAYFGTGQLEASLQEWFRVLRPGGIVLISVPDITVLATMLTDNEFTLDDLWYVTKVMYGAQYDKWDFHNVSIYLRNFYFTIRFGTSRQGKVSSVYVFMISFAYLRIQLLIYCILC